VRYDARGNILNKTGVGTYRYNSTDNRLQSVRPAGGSEVRYQYDRNGNIVGGDGGTLGYTSFDKPHTIARGGRTVKFAHDGERARYKRTAGTTVTYYVGNVEIRNLPDGSKRYTRYVEGHAIVRVTRGATRRTHEDTVYPIVDHLGGTDAIASAGGVLLHDLSFDAWGRRRSADAPQTLIENPVTTLRALLELTPRGYTGHEMLDAVGLIHMNGRVYDPKLGRFLSADPFVQFPGYTQSYNRYSYVLNNPLGYTDPSGYFVKELIRVVYDVYRIVASEGSDIQAWIDLARDVKALVEAFGSGGNNNDWAINNLDAMEPGLAPGAFSAAAGLQRAGVSTVGVQRNTLNSTIRRMVGRTYSDATGGKFANGAAYWTFAAIIQAAATFDTTNTVGDVEASDTTENREAFQEKLNVLVTDGTLSTKQGFETEDAAAKHVLEVTAPLSKQYGLEVGGNIYLGKDGLYHYTLPTIGHTGSVGISTRWAGYHTHPSGSLKFSNSHIRMSSDNDLHWVNQSGKALYLGVQQSEGVGIAVCEPGRCFDIGRTGSRGRVLQ